MKEIQGQFGTVRGVVHGAGVLADRKIVDQTDSQFDLVYDTKVKGLQHLYESIDPEALRFLILFSSSTARFGRSGQVAYAAANESRSTNGPSSSRSGCPIVGSSPITGARGQEAWSMTRSRRSSQKKGWL